MCMNKLKKKSFVLFLNDAASVLCFVARSQWKTKKKKRKKQAL